MVLGRMGKRQDAARLKLVKSLARKGAYLQPGVDSDAWQVVACWDGRSADKKNPLIPSEIVKGARSDGLLECVDGKPARLALSRAGYFWLKRRLCDGDTERAFSDQHRVITVRPGAEPGDAPVRENIAESPLAWMRSRRDGNGNPMIGDDQYRAGERLRRDFSFGQIEQRITSSWDVTAEGVGGRRNAPGSGGDLRDEVLDARDRVHRALSAPGPELGRALRLVCCELRGVEDLEKTMGWPRRSGRPILLIALSALARHYGYGPA